MQRRHWLGWIAALALASAPACGGDDDSNGGGGGGGQGNGPDGGANDVDSGPVPMGEWAWMPIDGMRCMNDTPTGIGINVNPAGTKLLLYMEGGGACFNSFTCSGVAHQNGFGETDFTQIVGDYGGVGLFDRADPDNPFRDYTFVFIPYCTGDIHAGSNPDGFGGRVQVGYENVGAALDALLPDYADADHVVLTGSSAGGFGAAYNFDRVQQAFGDVPVTLLDDSGPPLTNEFMTPCMQDNVREVWNLDATLPADCTRCLHENGGGLGELTLYLADKYPDRQFGLISSTRDGVIRLFYGWGYPSCSNPQVPMSEATFEQALRAYHADVLTQTDNFKLFAIDSGLHVWLLENPVGVTEVNGTRVTDWIRDMVADDQSWDHVIP